MGFAFFFFVSWLVTLFFTVMRKSLSFLENFFVWLVILIVSINWSWIIYEGYKFVEISTKPVDYTAFLFNRSMITPLIIVITLNAIKFTDSRGNSFLYAGFSITILLVLLMVGHFFTITKMNNWNVLFDVLYFLSLHLIAYFSLYMFRKLKRGEAMEA